MWMPEPRPCFSLRRAFLCETQSVRFQLDRLFGMLPEARVCNPTGKFSKLIDN